MVGDGEQVEAVDGGCENGGADSHEEHGAARWPVAAFNNPFGHAEDDLQESHEKKRPEEERSNGGHVPIEHSAAADGGDEDQFHGAAAAAVMEEIHRMDGEGE